MIQVSYPATFPECLPFAVISALPDLQQRQKSKPATPAYGFKSKTIKKERLFFLRNKLLHKTSVFNNKKRKDTQDQEIYFHHSVFHILRDSTKAGGICPAVIHSTAAVEDGVFAGNG